jgi:uncharacterized membrane protein
MTPRQARRLARYLFGASFIIAGLNHFFMTGFYVSIVPPYLPWPLALVIISGLAEIGLGALLLVQRGSALAAWGLIALLIAVFPANLHMALNPGDYPRVPGGAKALWGRLPLQGVFIAWVLRAMRR